jgi:MFS family permease
MRGLAVPGLPPPLRYADFRVLVLATVLLSVGFRGHLVVVGWLLLEESDSPFIVGLGIGSFLAPNVFVGVIGGAITDRLDRRLVIRLASLGMTLTTLLLALLTLGDVVIWQVLALTAASGALSSTVGTARQSYAYDIVGAEEAARGLALVTLGQRIGGVAGALVAGAALSLWGPGEAYLALCLPLLLSAISVLLARSKGQAAPISTLPILQNLREYAGELARNKTLAWLVLLTAAIEVFGFSHLSALPVLIRDELGGGGGDLGVVTAIASAGGILAILGFSARVGPTRRGLLFIVVTVVYGLTIIVLGFSQTLLMVILAALLVSALASLSDVLSQVLVQLAVPNEMRGRAMGTWALAIGSAPLGHLQIGALMSWLGVAAALAINGIALMIVALAAFGLVRRIREL